MGRKNLANKVPLSYAIDEFLEAKRAKGLAEKTIDNYSKSLKKFINFFEFDEETNLRDIDDGDFYHFINAMKDDEIRLSSINHYIRDLRAFFSWCSSRGWCEPTEALVESRGQQEEPRIFTEEELDALLLKPEESDTFTTYKMWVIINLMYDTGIRARSVSNLKLADIDFKAEEIYVRETKNKKPLNLPMSAALANVLKEYLRTTNIEEKKGQWLFPSLTGEQLTYNAMRQAFKRYCLARGVEHYNLHGLRYAFTKATVRSNLNQFKLQKMLGHQSMSMTSHYVKLYGGDLKENWDSYSPLDKKKKPAQRTAEVKRKK